jgi:hypothetical protein
LNTPCIPRSNIGSKYHWIDVDLQVVVKESKENALFSWGIIDIGKDTY